MINIRAKSEVYSFNHFQDMENVPKFNKVGIMTPFRPPLTNFAFFSIASLVFYMPNLKFLASLVFEIWIGSHNFKSRSRDPFIYLLRIFRILPWSSGVPPFSLASLPLPFHSPYPVPPSPLLPALLSRPFPIRSS